VRREWADRHGLKAVATQEFDASLDAVWERIGVNAEHSLPSRRDETIRAGLDKLGWEWGVMQRNVRGCTEEVCRLCHFGCQLGAKQSTLKTWVQDAHDAGARVLVETRAERVRIEGGAARGVEARTAAGHRVTVHARAVVSACGALHTPVLLSRSGVPSKALGKHLRLHPVLVVWGQFDEEVRPWEGMLSSTFSDRDADLDGRGYGVKYEHVATPPSILLSFSPWRGGRRHAELMQAMPYTGGLGVLLRDRGVGEVRTGRDGQPVVRYRLSPEDVDHMRRGVRGAARVAEAMGARRIYSSHSRWVAYEPGARGDLDGFMRDADACGWATGQAQLVSFHIMGSARMGGSPDTSVCDPTGQVWDVPGLYVCDGAAFPTASGVNPMVTIEALAHMNARGIAAKLS
jgi:choline dehydrogenase-like flavoprotein